MTRCLKPATKWYIRAANESQIMICTVSVLINTLIELKLSSDERLESRIHKNKPTAPKRTTPETLWRIET